MPEVVRYLYLHGQVKRGMLLLGCGFEILNPNMLKLASAGTTRVSALSAFLQSNSATCYVLFSDMFFFTHRVLDLLLSPAP